METITNSEELGGEWEVDYPYWNDTYTGGRSDQPPEDNQRIFAIDLASWSSRTGFASSNFRLTLFAFETTEKNKAIFE